MFGNNPNMSHMNPHFTSPHQSNHFMRQPVNNYGSTYSADSSSQNRQAVRGQATWTEGGQVTKCGIPWSHNQFMTVAVGANSPYKCGQNLKVRNLSLPGSREIIVTVVDEVVGYPSNRINLHRRAFQALGANPALGVINVEIIPSPELEQERWGKYLLEITQSAYPSYNVTEYNRIGKTKINAEQTKETYDFILQSPREKIKIRANVIYNPNTDRIITVDLNEMEI